MTTKEEYYKWCLQKKQNDDNIRKLETAKMRDQIRQEWNIRIWDIQKQLPEQIREDLDAWGFIQSEIESMEFPYRITPTSNVYGRSIEKEYREVEIPLLVLGKQLVFVQVRGHQALTANDIAYRVLGSESTYPDAETAIAIALEGEGWTG